MIKLTTSVISLILCCFLLDGVYGNGYNLHSQKNENLGEDPWWNDENEYLSGDDIIRRHPDVMDDNPRSRTERVDKGIKISDNLLNEDNNNGGDWDDQTYENIEDNGNRDFDDDGDWDYGQYENDGNEDEKENFDDDLNLDVEQKDNDRWKQQKLAYNSYEDNDNYDDYLAQQEYNNYKDDNWDEDRLGVSDNLEEGRYKRQVSAVNPEKEGISDDFYFVEGEGSSLDDIGCIGTECRDEREDGGITSPERDGSFLDLGSDPSADYFIT